MVSIAVASLASCSKKGPYLQNDQPKESQFETAGKVRIERRGNCC